MGSIFYVIGIALAGYAGYSNFEWYFIIISSLIMAIGWSIIRAPQIKSAVAETGIGALPKLLSMSIILYLIITTPVYFIASLFN